MRHGEHFKTIEVGCICAGIMECNILAAKERDRLMKNRAQRKRNFPNRHWRKNRYRNLFLTYQGRALDSFLSAAYAAFDLVDPVEAVRK